MFLVHSHLKNTQIADRVFFHATFTTHYAHVYIDINFHQGYPMVFLLFFDWLSRGHHNCQIFATFYPICKRSETAGFCSDFNCSSMQNEVSTELHLSFETVNNKKNGRQAQTLRIGMFLLLKRFQSVNSLDNIMQTALNLLTVSISLELILWIS